MPHSRLSIPAGNIAYGSPHAVRPGVLERDAIFCYEGDFVDMDGNAVPVTAKKLKRLADIHNARYQAALMQAVEAGKTEVDPAHCPPLQVDHSTSGWDTVGRIFGMLRLVEGYVPEPGMKPVTALAGPVRFLGEDNCLRASDGRWASLSTAADFDQGIFTELTVTPFPAARSARLLSQGKEKGASMDKEKLKRHLTECKKMSADDADKHLAALSEEDEKKLASEADEHEKKLAADEDENKKKLAAEKDDEEKKKLAAEEDKKKDDEKKLAAETARTTRLSAAKTSFVKLAKDMRGAFAETRTETRKSGIVNRLAALKTKAKITPAEVKNIDLAKLSAKSDSELEAYFEGFESREAVVMVGQRGTANAEPVARLARQREKVTSKQSRLSNMPFTGRALAAKHNMEVDQHGIVRPKRLAAMDPTAATGQPIPQGTDHEASLATLNSHFAEACKMMDEGKREDCLRHLKDWMLSSRSSGLSVDSSDATARMSKLAEHSKKLENQFEELVKMVAPVLEVGDSDLA